MWEQIFRPTPSLTASHTPVTPADRCSANKLYGRTKRFVGGRSHKNTQSLDVRKSRLEKEGYSDETEVIYRVL